MQNAHMAIVDTEWLKARKKELGLTDQAISDALGRERSIANKILNGKLPFDMEHLDGFARVLKVSKLLVLQRFGILDEVDVVPIDTPGTATRVLPSDSTPTWAITSGDGSIALRQIDLGFSMGDGSNIDDYVEEGTIDFDANLLRSITRSPPNRLFVARGEGDSMFPTLINNDIVVIDTLQTTLNLIDKVWAISLFGAGGIKRLRPIGEGKVEVISDNPAHKDQVVTAEDLRIMGRVIWVARRI